MAELLLIAHDIRSAHNVGSLLRTAEGLGAQVLLTGYTPYPLIEQDDRLPHIANKLHRQISKTALGAETKTIWSRNPDLLAALASLKADGFKIVGLEQTKSAVALSAYSFAEKTALLLGSEVTGISPDIIGRCDQTVVIPMFGEKESFNVVQAAAMAMYEWRFGAKH